MKRQGGGHIAIVVGRDQHGNLTCIGGNQGDEVTIRHSPPTGRLAIASQTTCRFRQKLAFGRFLSFSRTGEYQHKKHECADDKIQIAT